MTTWTFKILIDGQCPLCRREAAFLRWLDRNRGRLLIEDITVPGFDAGLYGTSRDALMRQIHGVTPSGRIVKGMEVFRRAYAAVGFGWLLAPTAWPIIKPLADTGYAWFARNRMLLGRWVGGCDSDHCRPGSINNVPSDTNANQ